MTRPGAGVLLTALGLLALAWLWPPGAQAAFPGENGKIAFERGGETWVMNADGTGRVPLTCSAAAEPAWSPNGRRIAFARARDVWVMNDDGSGQARVGRGLSPAWSPNGQRIAFHTPPTRLFEGVIGVMNADGSGSATFFDADGGSSPAWSPDGQRIAFDRSGDIWTVNPDGDDPTRLYEAPRGGGQGSAPTWSPDGQRIAFARGPAFSFGAPVGDIWAIDADGTGPARLTNGRSRDGAPSWSPDGERIVFARAGDIWAMDADGSRQVNLTRSQVTEGDPDWQRLPAPPVDPPPREFCFRELRRNVNRGIARLTVRVPGPGRVVLQQRPGVSRFAQAHQGEGVGRVVLRVRPRGGAQRRLARAGGTQRRVRVAVRAQVTFNPDVGEPLTKGRRVWLVRDRR